MQIHEANGSVDHTGKRRKMTEEELQREFKYLVANSITRRMLHEGLITDDENKRIRKLNRETFKPFLYELMSDD